MKKDFKFTGLLVFTLALAGSIQAVGRSGSQGGSHESHKHPVPGETPWFTGPILTPSSNVVPIGHINVQPYVFATNKIGTYLNNWDSNSVKHSWNFIGQIPIQVGISETMDIKTAPTLFYNRKGSAHAWEFGDLPIGIEYQVCTAADWYPGVKFSITESFPTGKYQKLNPAKKGTDSSGTGSYQTEFGIGLGKIYKIVSPDQFLNVRLFGSYTLCHEVHVKGFNTYGGGYGAHGIVKPGSQFNLSLGLEYSLTQNWVLAYDLVYNHANKTKFYGNPGTVNGLPSVVGGRSTDQFSMAPALEYNWSQNVGVIGGVWFTFAGRNTTRFVSYVLALNVYI